MQAIGCVKAQAFGGEIKTMGLGFGRDPARNVFERQGLQLGTELGLGVFQHQIGRGLLNVAKFQIDPHSQSALSLCGIDFPR